MRHVELLLGHLELDAITASTVVTPVVKERTSIDANLAEVHAVEAVDVFCSGVGGPALDARSLEDASGVQCRLETVPPPQACLHVPVVLARPTGACCE